MKENIFLMDAGYSIIQNKPVVILHGINEKKRSVAVLDDSFEPYFYVIPKSSINKLRKRIEKLSFHDHEDLIQVKKVEIVKRKLVNKETKVLKVFSSLPSEIPKIKDVVKEWGEVEGKREFDIPFFRRYLLDKQISPLSWIEVDGEKVQSDLKVDLAIEAKSIKRTKKKEPKLKILAFDIETLPEKGKQKIILLSVKTNTGFNKVLTYQKDNFKHSMKLKAEKELIEEFIKIVDKINPDFIVTYNGDAFDLPVLRERSENYKIKLDLGRDNQQVVFQRKGRESAAIIKGRVHVDLFSFVSKIIASSLQSETLTLDNVANEILGERKKEMRWEDLIDYWNKKRKLDKLADYCLKDSDLTLKLGEQLLPNIFEFSKLTEQIPFDVSRMTYGQLVEAYLMKEAVLQKTLIPNRPTREKIAKRRAMAAYVGGYVKEPKTGIYENIIYLDYRSLYPSIISSYNIDPSTFNCGCCKVGHKIDTKGYHFCKKNKGLISETVTKLLKQRIEVKKKIKRIKKESLEYQKLDSLQYALKIILNATYGGLAYPGARWYKRECAESTAAMGRVYIHKVIDMAEKEGFDVLYADTDSVLLNTKGNVRKRTSTFLNKVNRKLPGLMELELEGIYPRGIFISAKGEERGAKKRYALIDSKGKITIRGLEKVRRDWSKLAKDTQEEVINLVLTRKKDKAIEVVQKTIEDLKSERVDLKDLIIYTQLTRALKSYELIGPHVAAAKRALKRGVVVHPGETVSYIITKGKGRISDKSELYQFAKNYDVDYYLFHQIIPAALRVLNVLGVTEDDLLKKSKQVGLKKFTK